MGCPLREDAPPHSYGYLDAETSKLIAHQFVRDKDKAGTRPPARAERFLSDTMKLCKETLNIGPIIRLGKIAIQAYNKFSYNLYYMVAGSESKNSYYIYGARRDFLAKKKLDMFSEQLRNESGTAMKEIASNYTPPYVVCDENIKQRWNHRHHLHVTEVSK